MYINRHIHTSCGCVYVVITVCVNVFTKTVGYFWFSLFFSCHLIWMRACKKLILSLSKVWVTVFHVLIIASASFCWHFVCVCGVFVAFVKTRVICFLVGCLCEGGKSTLKKKRLLSFYPIQIPPFGSSFCFHTQIDAWRFFCFHFSTAIVTW